MCQKARPCAPYACSARPQSVRNAIPDTTRHRELGIHHRRRARADRTTVLRWKATREEDKGAGTVCSSPRVGCGCPCVVEEGEGELVVVGEEDVAVAGLLVESLVGTACANLHGAREEVEVPQSS